MKKNSMEYSIFGIIGLYGSSLYVRYNIMKKMKIINYTTVYMTINYYLPL